MLYMGATDVKHRGNYVKKIGAKAVRANEVLPYREPASDIYRSQSRGLTTPDPLNRLSLNTLWISLIKYYMD